MGNTETMKGMGRAGRVKVNGKKQNSREQSTKRNCANTRVCSGKPKTKTKPYLTEPTSLEMLSTVIVPNRKCPGTWGVWLR